MLKTIPLILILATGAFGQSFSKEWTKVPLTFVPDDGKAVHNAVMSSAGLKNKDEFETTADFQKRRSDPKLVSAGKGKTANDTLVFRLGGDEMSLLMSDLNPVVAKYDADAQSLAITLKLERFDYIPDDGRPKVAITGVKFPGVDSSEKIERLKVVKRHIWHGLGITNLLHLGGPNLRFDMSDLPPSQAKMIKTNLAALLVTKLISPYHEGSLLTSKPTIERPYETDFYTFLLIGEVSEIWFYNAKTGEIYKKIIADKTLGYLEKSTPTPVSNKTLDSLEKPTPKPLPNSNVPGISYIISVQNSGNVRQQLDKMVEMGKTMVAQNCPKDEAAVLRFVGRDKIDITQPFTANKNDLNDGLDNLFIEGGQTALIDATYLSIESLTEVKTSNRKGVVLMTNGDDSNSYYNEKQLINLAKESKVPIYAIAFVDDLSKDGGFTTKSPQSKAKAFLERLTKETGGKVFFPNSPSEVAAMGKEILLSLHGGTSSPCH